MPQTLDNEQGQLTADLQRFSCLTCRQRKVKCDRRNPCANCTKTATQCSFIPPVRGKRVRRIAPKEGLHAKLRRYEAMVKSYEAKIKLSDNGNVSDVETPSEPDTAITDITDDAESCANGPNGPSAFNGTKTRLISKNGSARYFDSGLWSDLGREYHSPEDERLAEMVDEPNIQTSDLFMDSAEESHLVLGTFSRIKNLAILHPPLHILKKLWEIYIDRVDPLMKMLHLPSFWLTMTSALENPHAMPKSVEAVIFAFYLATITSLDDSECYCLLGEQKAIISARYKIALRQTLINAAFLKTSSLMTLQAYVIFLMYMRDQYQSDTLYILSGIAVRLARRMGLHRDGTFLGLSPFDIEMRRRLWWHIVHVDFRVSDFSGTKPSMDLFLSDTKIPLNVEDDDLSPDMVNLPPERTGITSMVLFLIRCDVTDFLRRVTPQLSCDVRWGSLTSPCISLAEKDNMINQMEDVLERKYLRYHDPSNPLHYFSSILARSSICKMKIFAHNPRQFSDSGVKVPQKSRDIIFETGTKFLEYGILVHSTQTLRKFIGQLSTNYLWEPLLYVLIETRHRKIGPDVDRAWQLIGGVFANYPQVFTDVTEALYAALGNWALQVWDDCAAARKLQGLSESPIPEYITAIRRCRRPSVKPSSKPNILTDNAKVIGNSTSYDEFQSLKLDGNLITDPLPLDSYDFSNLLSFDLEPNEWAQWERLLAGQCV